MRRPRRDATSLGALALAAIASFIAVVLYVNGISAVPMRVAESPGVPALGNNPVAVEPRKQARHATPSPVRFYNYSTWWRRNPKAPWRYEYLYLDNATYSLQDALPPFYPGEIGLSSTRECAEAHYRTRSCRIIDASPIPFVPKQPSVCMGQRPYPHFSFQNPARDAFTLADVAAQFNRTTTSLLFIGDSSILEWYDNALCHLARIPQVRVLRRSTVEFAFAPNRSREALNLERMQNTLFAIDTAHSTVYLQMVFLRMARAHASHWPLFPQYFGSGRFQLIVHAMGLHYNGHKDNNGQADETFNNDLYLMHKALARTDTTIVLMSHSAQHYSTHMGWWRLWGMDDNKKECEPIAAGAVGEADRHTRWIQDGVLPRVNSTLVPPPWEDLSALACRPRALDWREVYFVPQFDLSFELERFHLSRRLKSVDKVVMDCTHYVRTRAGGALVK